MKKYLSYILPLIFSACTQLPMPPVSDLEELQFNGPVHTVAVIEQEAVDDNGRIVTLDTLTNRIITFTPEGLVDSVVHESGVERYHYAPGKRTIERLDIDGEPDHNEIATFDAHGNLIEWEMVAPEGRLMSREEYRYQDRRCVEKQILSEDGASFICRDYRYDEAGHLLAYNAYNHDGSLNYGWQCTCDTAGRLLTEQWLDTDGSVMSTSLYTYCADGLKESEQTDLTRVEYTYELDSYGNYTTRVATFYSPGMNPNYIITHREIQYY